LFTLFYFYLIIHRLNILKDIFLNFRVCLNTERNISLDLTNFFKFKEIYALK